MTAAVASLGMYDHSAQRAANDRLWEAMAHLLNAGGIAAPRTLDRARSVEAIWRDPALLFGQACGYPLVSESDLALHVVGIPVYAVPDCGGGEHCSYLLVRAADTDTDTGTGAALEGYRGRRAAINAWNSNSGHNLFRAAVAPLASDGRFFASVVVTGAHRASIAALIRAEADIAAIDAVSYAALRRYEPEAVASLRILAVTQSSPALPFVAARSASDETVAALRDALARIVADPALADVRDALFLKDVIPGGIERFAALRTIAAEAIDAGYPSLR